MPGNNQKDYYHTPITRLPEYDMLQRSIHQPAELLKEKNFSPSHFPDLLDPPLKDLLKQKAISEYLLLWQ